METPPAIRHPTMAPRVAVLILNRNGEALLPACLRSVEASTWPDLHILVTDNGSTDGSAELVERDFPCVRLQRLPANLGVAGGRNASVAWLRRSWSGDWLFFVDNDTVVEPDTVTRLVAAGTADPRIGIVTAKAFRMKGDTALLAAGGMGFNPCTGATWDVAAGETDCGRHDRPADVQACPGYAMFARAGAFERVGGFDEGFNPYGWEDVDVSLRIGRAGFRLVYAPDAVVYHAGGRAGRGPVAAYERFKTRRLIRLVRLHSNWLQWSCFLALFPARALWRALREIVSGHPQVVGAWIRGLLDRPDPDGRIG